MNPTAGPRYVLIAEADIARAAWCLEALRPSGLGALVARDGNDASAILRQFGAPVLLLTALSLPDGEGFAVMRAVRHLAGPDAAAIVAITSIGHTRLPLEARKALGISAALPSTASLKALREVIDKALKETGVSVPRASDASEGRAREQDVVDQTLRDLAEEATQVTGVPGAAVYVKASPHDRFRAHVNWTGNDADRGSPFSLPYVFERVLETGVALVLPDLATEPLLAAPTATIHEVVRGLVAAPLAGGTGRVLGAVCVFDVKPLSIGAAGVNALRALGRRAGAVLEALAPTRAAVPPEAPAPDPVTGLPTEHGSRTTIAEEIERARVDRSPLSLILIGIDGFAGLEQQNERPVVNRVLRSVSQEVRSVLRQSDVAIKWAANEFLIVLPTVSVNIARDVAGRILTATREVPPRKSTPVTISAAVTELPPGEAFDAALERVSAQLRGAGRQGGNRIC
jgi:diguanylate cyclase (GGDEF)-like protein